jgi:cytochrome c oxidase cbb3-type subunit 1
MIDASCRWPLLGLYYGAAFWLLVASVASLIASMSFHAPAMFADCAWLSYGRMAPLANDLLIYGFCVPAGWAAVLWLLARVGQTPLVNGAAVLFGTKIWNIGILLGSIGILSGGGSGVEALEFPLYAAWTLLLGAVLIGISGLNTLRARSEPLMHPVQWFAGLSILWFPWIYLTALIFLQMSPVRGMAQGAVHWWFEAQLQVVLLGLMGVAALFYFMPALRRDALASRQLAWFALITLILCGGWTGVPRTAPVPAWMAIISQVMCISLAVPVLAIILNLWHLRSADTPPEGRFFRFGIRSFILWTGGVVLLSGTGLWGTASFTLVDPALTQLLLQGFSVMVSLGVAYSVLPRIAGGALPFPRAARLHFWMAAVGILLVVVPFLAGGFRQGGSLAEVDIPFMEIASATLMPIRVGSMGQLLLIVGHGFLLLNVVALMIRFLRAQLKRFDNAPVTLAGTTEGRA